MRKRTPHVSAIVSALLAIGFGLGATRDFASEPSSEPSREPKRGPDLIRWYFDNWHAPFPGDLERTHLDQIWDEINAMPAEPEGARGAPWQPVGPFGMERPGAGRASGRVLDLALDANGLRRVASASGGLWSLDGGSWQAVSDEITTQWMGSVAVHPTQPGTMLLGTGEPFIRNGTGLWKTTNGGQDWTRKTLSPEPQTCFRIRYAQNGTTVHGAFDQGYYRSTNGGESWTRLLANGWPTDLALHPTNSNILFVTVQSQGLFRSTNGGSTWAEVEGVGLPLSDMGRGALTICAADPNRLYVAYAGADSRLLGLFRTTNGGANWTDVSPEEYLWGQGWYNNTIAVCPTDPDLVLAGGGALMRSTDGGLSWEISTATHLHADYHAIAWSSDGQECWVGHDGGWGYSSDQGATWTTEENTLPITQYVSIHASSTSEPLVAGGGSQDNGTSVTTDGGATWFFRGGGDGGGFSVDPNLPSRMFSTHGVYGGAWPFRRFRSTDSGVTWTFIDGGIGIAQQWFTDIRNDMVDPVRIYTYGNGWVYESPIFGALWWVKNNPAFPHWVSELTVSRFEEPAAVVYACLDATIDGERLRVFDDTTWHERSAGLPSGVRVRKVPVHPLRKDWAFALMNGLGNPGQKIFRTTDRGVTWTNLTGNLPDVPVSDLVAHPTDDAKLYLGTEFGCFRTTNGGAVWERWHSGLPESITVTEMAYVDRIEESGKLYIVLGTYGRGMWVREIESDDTSHAPGSPGAFNEVELHANSPNPFTQQTSLSFTLPQASRVILRIVDAAGREVARPVSEIRVAGFHRVCVDGSSLAAGVYFAQLEVSGRTSSRRIVRLD